VIVYLQLLDACSISALVLCVAPLHSFSFILFDICSLLDGSTLLRLFYGLAERKEELGLETIIQAAD